MIFDIIKDLYGSVGGGCKFRERGAETKLSYSAKRGKEIPGDLRPGHGVLTIPKRGRGNRSVGVVDTEGFLKARAEPQAVWHVPLCSSTGSLMAPMWIINAFIVEGLERQDRGWLYGSKQRTVGFLFCQFIYALTK